MDLELTDSNTYFVDYQLLDYQEEGYYFVMEEKREFNSNFLLSNMQDCSILFAGSYVVVDIKGEYFAFDTSTYINQVTTDFLEATRPFSFVFTDTEGNFSKGITVSNH